MCNYVSWTVKAAQIMFFETILSASPWFQLLCAWSHKSTFTQFSYPGNAFLFQEGINQCLRGWAICPRLQSWALQSCRLLRRRHWAATLTGYTRLLNFGRSWCLHLILQQNRKWKIVAQIQLFSLHIRTERGWVGSYWEVITMPQATSGSITLQRFA